MGLRHLHLARRCRSPRFRLCGRSVAERERFLRTHRLAGQGQDLLRGGAGNDSYQFARGDGVDHIDQFDALDGDWDTVEFAPGIASDQLWFRQIGLNLEVSVVGTSDRIVVDRWYDEASPRVDAFVAGDGQQLFSEQVDALVRVMADLAPPAMGQTSLSATPYASVLTPVLASNWT